MSVLSSSPISCKRIDDAADLGVGVLGEPGVGLHEPRRDALLVGGQRIPCRDLLWPFGQLSVLRG